MVPGTATPGSNTVTPADWTLPPVPFGTVTVATLMMVWPGFASTEIAMSKTSVQLPLAARLMPVTVRTPPAMPTVPVQVLDACRPEGATRPAGTGSLTLTLLAATPPVSARVMV